MARISVTCLPMLSLLLFGPAMKAASLEAPRPHIIAIIQDDLGYDDVEFMNGNNAVLNVSSNVSRLAHEGVILRNHYTHWHCSPTRRSFISGRFPIHHSEDLSGVQSDDLDLRWTWISQKLKSQGYENYWVGKGHTGYKSWNHLPLNRGFDGHRGYLTGAQAYTSNDRWIDDSPWRNNTEYSSDLYGQRAVEILNSHDPATPLFIYLPFQAVHSPYNPVPGWHGETYKGMLWSADRYIGQIESVLRSKDMWNSTLIYYSSDNGGVLSGINYPLRGEKHSNWEGGIRTAAFFSGGFLPENLRGTNNTVNMHIADMYPTFCELAGADPTDNPPVEPLPVDPSNPQKDIYGNSSFPPLDGRSVWSAIMEQSSNVSAVHEYMAISKEVLIIGDYKLLVSQPKWKTNNNGWKQPDGKWDPCNEKDWPCSKEDIYFNDWHRPVAAGGRPCLFRIREDISEKLDLAEQNPDLVSSYWEILNNTILTTFHSRSPASMLGPCNKTCTNEKWNQYGKGGSGGPECGVPGCD